jgi:hypothetical protein
MPRRAPSLFIAAMEAEIAQATAVRAKRFHAEKQAMLDRMAQELEMSQQAERVFRQAQRTYAQSRARLEETRAAYQQAKAAHRLCREALIRTKAAAGYR